MRLVLAKKVVRLRGSWSNSLLIMVLGLIIVVTSACRTKTQTDQIELIVSAAASLSESLKDIQTLYERTNSHVKLNYNFAASGTLQQQIEQGAPVDLFLSAGKEQMQALIEKQFIDTGWQMTLLTNRLVLIVPADEHGAMQTLADLKRDNVNKIAIGQPESVPAGRYTKEALLAAGLWDSLKPKIVPAKDVRQVLTYVETGNTDAGFVYETDALSSNKVKIALTVDDNYHSPIEYPFGIVTTTKHRHEAEAFYSFLLSREAKDIFVKHGFSLFKES